jgi:aspartate oxidase
MWWLMVDKQTMETTISWLYAIWECTSWLHGANRLPWNSLMESLVFGSKAAQYLNTISSSTPTKNNNTNIQIPKEWTLSTIYVIDKIRKLMLNNASIGISAWHLRSAITILDDLEEQIASKWLKMWVDLYQTVVEHKRCFHLMILAKSITKAMYHRQESRGSFTRSDFPQTSDAYQKHSLLSYQKGAHHLELQEADLPSIKILRAIQEYPATTHYWLIE